MWGCQPGTAPPGGCFPWGGRGGQFCTHFSFNRGSSVCPTRQPVLPLRGVGWEIKCRCHRSPQQRTMGSCCTMGTTTTLRWSCTRAMYVSATTQAATPALPSTGREGFFRPTSCPQGLGDCQGGVSWAKSRWLSALPETWAAQAERAFRPPSPAPCWVRGSLGPEQWSHPSPSTTASQGAPQWGGEAD